MYNENYEEYSSLAIANFIQVNNNNWFYFTILNASTNTWLSSVISQIIRRKIAPNIRNN